MRPKYTLIHYHIFKNAGTSIDVILKECFGNTWATFEGQHAHDVQSADQLRRFLAEHSAIRAVSSHLARPPLPFTKCLPITFLRHPILRARSVYEFSRRDTSQPNHGEAARRGFSSYVKWAIRSARTPVIRDYQVVHLSKASFRGDIRDTRATEDDLVEACAVLDQWQMVGIVEEFGRSIAAYRRQYAPLVPELILRDAWENRTRVDPLPPTSELASIKDELGEPLFDELMDANALDLRLYEHGVRVLHRVRS